MNGPWMEFSGADIFMHPRPSQPLSSYDEDAITKGSEDFFKSIEDLTDNWWNKFPGCCPTHIELEKTHPDLKKEFSFIPNQVVNSAKYFFHAVDLFFRRDSWFHDITEYYDYLIYNFGSPGVGSHIFDQAVETLIYHGELDHRIVTDDEKLKLLNHIFPDESIIQSRKITNLNELYIVFQSWLSVMPSFGEFIVLKKRLEGKSPMNLFMTNTVYNKYLGLSKFETKSPSELIEDLNLLAISLLESVNNTMESGLLNNPIFELAEERLRISQRKILSREPLVAESSKLVIDWMNSWIEYFQVIENQNQNNRLESVGKVVTEVKEVVEDTLSVVDIVRIEMSALKVSKQIKDPIIDYCESDDYRRLSSEIENLNENDAHELLALIEKKRNETSTLVAHPQNRTKLSVKHRIRMTIPLFIGVVAMSEIEVSNTQDFPRNLAELRALLLK